MRALALGLLSLASAATSADQVDRRAQAIIERTRETRADYSVFAWNWITPEDGNPREEWAAEFNRGRFHRVETPRDRLIADCDAQTGIYYSVETRKRLSGQAVAKAACGVQANSNILSASYDGASTGRFGKVDHITVRDMDNVRTYEVASNGAIVGATIESPERRAFLKMAAAALVESAPDNIFTEQSLAQSAVPEKFRHKPT